MDFLSDRLNAGEGPYVRAGRIGIAYRTLREVERNSSSMPSAAVALKVAQFYGCDVTDLWPPRSDEVAA
ncbi:MAG: helix-turn-helix transcriptional regulator [Solirubrobacteraceae bacterium]